ncbi:MAG: putative porin [Candidatus Omnitrophica bacterium]|nr:putative porin [Candidatus Omnitrophota bacterium]MDD5500318.1 putative porin [Candidatus Omnitrophota bacterium]
MKKLFIAMVMAGFCLLGAGTRVSYAGEIDLLLEKLVDKGVLTGAEAQQVKYETREQMKKEITTGKSESLPAWLQKIKLKGDLRLRYQYQHTKNDGDVQKDVNIGRVRMRLGLEAKINEKLMAGIGIATGSGDPRSTNVTFGNTKYDGLGGAGYSTKFEIKLDYAYAKYSPLPWLELVGGKMLLKDVFWEPTDLIWDTDITPEGGVIGFNKSITPSTSLFMKTGALVVQDDTSSTSDPAMAYIVQAGASQKVNSDVSLKGAFTMYNFSNIKGATSSGKSSGTNTGNVTKGSSQYAYNYNMLNPALELSIKEPFKAIGGLGVEKLKLFGEYVRNTEAPDRNTGFSMGFQFGKDKVKKWGDWQVKYIYAMLEKDAVLDVLPDSDRYGGKTGMRSHEVSFTYGLGTNTYFGLDVYRSWNIQGSARKAPETLVQVDWNMKF